MSHEFILNVILLGLVKVTIRAYRMSETLPFSAMDGSPNIF